MTDLKEPLLLLSEDDRPSVIEELMRLEPLFHHAELGTTWDEFDSQTADDFWEVGASGQSYTRDFVWSVLESGYAGYEDDLWKTSEFKCRQLSTDTYLLTYLLQQHGRLTRRATIWQLAPRGWQTIYHQGTIVADPS